MRSIVTSGLRSNCPINLALESLGDAWSLLIVRDLMFKGRTSYKEFLDAGEGISTNILADRLQRLEALEIVAKTADPDDARRYVYRLTEIGIDLAPLLVEMILWSVRHFETDAPAEIVEEMTLHRSRFLNRVRRRWEDGAGS